MCKRHSPHCETHLALAFSRGLIGVACDTLPFRLLQEAGGEATELQWKLVKGDVNISI